MTTSKDGFPLKAEDGEDLLKGLKDLKVKLTEKAYTESADLREIGKPATFEFEPADRRVLTAEEKKAAEGIRMYVGRLQKGGADV